MAGKYRRGPDDIERVKKTIYLESELKERLEELAVSEGRSVSAMIERLLAERVEELESEQEDESPRKRGSA